MTASAPTSGSNGLSRRLGRGAAVAIVVGSVIGSGVFLKPGQIAQDGGDFGISILAWILGGGISLIGGLCMCELALMMPQSGGHYVYIREAYGRGPAFLAGWNDTIMSQPAANAALAVAGTNALYQLLGQGKSAPPGIVLMMALAVIGLLSMTNILGVAWGGLVQSITTVIKAGFLVLCACLPLYFATIGSDVVSFANYSTVNPAAMGESFIDKLALVMVSVMWAYAGWHFIAPVAEEVKDPKKNITTAIVGGIGILMVIYVAFNVALHSMLPMDRMANAGSSAPQEALYSLFLPSGENYAQLARNCVSAVIVISTFSAINSGLLVIPRITYAMARDGVFFAAFSRTHRRYRTPVLAIALQGIMALLMVAGSFVLTQVVEQYTSKQDMFHLLSDLSVFTSVFFLMLATSAVIYLRYRQPERERPYRVPWFPLLPILFLAFSVWFISMVTIQSPQDSAIGIAIILLALPVYFLFKSSRKSSPDNDQATPQD